MPSQADALVRLEVGDLAVAVDLAEGARAVSWTVAGVELLGHRGDDGVEHGMYPMAPWAGRVRDNAVTVAGMRHDLPVTYAPWALHGTAFAQRGTVIERVEEPDRSLLVARIADHPGWPWPMAVDITWDLRPRDLHTAITVHALAEPFPAVVGWHPWFRRDLGVGAEIHWGLTATEQLVRGDDHLPTGQRVPYDPSAGPFDDAFEVPSGSGVVEWPGALRLSIEGSGSWFVVFDELADFVCVEPQSGPPDGLGAAPEVEPGHPLTMTTRWAVEPLSRGAAPGGPAGP